MKTERHLLFVVMLKLSLLLYYLLGPEFRIKKHTGVVLVSLSRVAAILRHCCKNRYYQQSRGHQQVDRVSE